MAFSPRTLARDAAQICSTCRIAVSVVLLQLQERNAVVCLLLCSVYGVPFPFLFTACLNT